MSIIHDFMLYTSTSLDIKLGYLKHTFWHKYNDKVKECSFCKHQGVYFNHGLEMFSCSKCYDLLQLHEKNANLQFILSPVDDVGKSIRQLTCDWINNHYHKSGYIDAYYKDDGYCCICNLEIRKNVGYCYLSNEIIAHFECFKKTGFIKYFNDIIYNEIIKLKLENNFITYIFTDIAIYADIRDGTSFPDFVDWRDIEAEINLLNAKNWDIDNTGTCSFCGNVLPLPQRIIFV